MAKVDGTRRHELTMAKDPLLLQNVFQYITCRVASSSKDLRFKRMIEKQFSFEVEFLKDQFSENGL